MKIAKAGRPIIASGLLVTAIGSLPVAGPARWILVPLGLGFAAFCAYFFRDPDRPAPTDSQKIYSPGDGRVLSVAKEGPGNITTIRIFLSVFDVHVQRMPCSGTVRGVQYQPGSFLMAMKDDARTNERNIVVVAPDKGRPQIIVEQIAGFIARRIECWVKEGDQAAAGQRYGIIHFGSQAAVHLPESARSIVRPGDRVAGGLTPIAEWIA